MNLARERNRGERRSGQDQPPAVALSRPLEGPEREGEKHRDRPEQMAHALLHPIRRDRERQASGECGAARQAQLAQPGAGGEARQAVAEELQRVPAADRAEHRSEWPEDDPERPAGEVRLRLCLRAERIGIAPGRASMLELVADEPIVVERLQMVSGRSLAVCRSTTREKVGSGVQDRRPGRRHTGGEVQRGPERYKACAARSSSSKSGTSAVS